MPLLLLTGFTKSEMENIGMDARNHWPRARYGAELNEQAGRPV